MKKFMIKHKQTCLTMVIIVAILVGLIVLFKKDMIERATSGTQMPPSATPIQTTTTSDIPTPTLSNYEKASKAFA